MRLRKRKPLPLPPENVRAIYADGRVIPLECVYLGPNHRGIHIWGAVVVIEAETGMRVTCDRLPPLTGVAVKAEREVEP